MEEKQSTQPAEQEKMEASDKFKLSRKEFGIQIKKVTVTEGW